MAPNVHVQGSRGTCARSLYSGQTIALKEWHSEEQIKAQLRRLTEETRKLRRDLDAMVKPGPQSPSRAFIHKQTWPKEAPAPAVVNDRRQRRSKKR
jgi:hypothetical protein